MKNNKRPFIFNTGKLGKSCQLSDNESSISMNDDELSMGIYYLVDDFAFLPPNDKKRISLSRLLEDIFNFDEDDE